MDVPKLASTIQRMYRVLTGSVGAPVTAGAAVGVPGGTGSVAAAAWATRSACPLVTLSPLMT
jgi:hypothetical protein